MRNTNRIVWMIAGAACLAGSASAQWSMQDYYSRMSDAAQYARQHGLDIADAWAALEREGTKANEQANDRFRREHAYRPSPPAKISASERKKLEKDLAEYEAIQAACAAARAGKYEDALAEIAKVPGGDRDVNILNFKARTHTLAGQYDLAMQDYDQLLSLAKDVPNLEKHSTALAQAHISRSRVLQLARKYDAAAAELELAAKIGGVYLDPYLMQVERAELDLNSSNLEKAVDDFTALIQHFASADRYAKRGFAYFYLGQRDKAKEDLDKAVAGKSAFAPGWLSHAFLAALGGDSKVALDECDYVIKELPRDPYAHAVKGNIYAALMKDPAKAIEEYDAALKLNPNLPQVTEWRAQAAKAGGGQ